MIEYNNTLIISAQLSTMNMNQARNGHRSKKTGSTRNISTDIHAGHPMA